MQCKVVLVTIDFSEWDQNRSCKSVQLCLDCEMTSSVLLQSKQEMSPVTDNNMCMEPRIIFEVFEVSGIQKSIRSFKGLQQ